MFVVSRAELSELTLAIVGDNGMEVRAKILLRVLNDERFVRSLTENKNRVTRVSESKMASGCFWQRTPDLRDNAEYSDDPPYDAARLVNHDSPHGDGHTGCAASVYPSNAAIAFSLLIQKSFSDFMGDSQPFAEYRIVHRFEL